MIIRLFQQLEKKSVLSPNSYPTPSCVYSFQVLQILEQVQKKHLVLPTGGTGPTKGREELQSRGHAVHNGVGRAALVEPGPDPTPDSGCEHHTRF